MTLGIETELRGARAVDLAEERSRGERRAHWDAVARRWERRRGLGGAYHRRLERVYGFLVPPGSRVLELGCGRGDLLMALRPASGVGVDFSPETLRQARARHLGHPELRFVEADAEALAETLSEALADSFDGRRFDAIILSDLVNDAWDVQRLFEQVRALAGPQTRIVLNLDSRVWEPALLLAQRLGLAHPVLPQNWLTVDDV